MSFRNMVQAIRWDMKRAQQHFRKPALAVIAFSPGFQAVAAYRFFRWLNSRINSNKVIWLPILVLEAICIRIVEIMTGIHINLDARIESGLLIAHFGGIVIGEQVIVGRNCDIFHGVTLGYGGSGDKAGYPEIGERVYIATGAKVIGKIKIGNDVLIGTSAVVTRSIPDRAVVAGIPAEILSMKGSFDHLRYPGMETDEERQKSLAQLDLEIE